MSKKAISEAVLGLNLPATRRLLGEHPGLLAVRDRQGRNLLHMVCSIPPERRIKPDRLQVQLAEFLLDQGFEIDEPVGKDRCTALFFAVARARNPSLVKLLIRHGAKPAEAPGGGLYAAGWWGDLENLDLLLRAGADIDVVVGVTPFLACWEWHQFEAAKFLACQGANVNVQDRKGRTALHLGIEKAYDPALLRWLVQHGADPEIEDHTGVSARLKASRKRDRKYLSAVASGTRSPARPGKSAS